MKIGIDISQIVYQTGVSNYLENLVLEMIKRDKDNEYVLFFSSLRKDLKGTVFNSKDLPPSVSLKKYRIPPKVLSFVWNDLHIFPIEYLIGEVDWFITSDWTEPPSKKALKATIIYDLIVYKYPKETHEKIVDTHKKKLSWVKKESSLIFTISNSSKKDISEILGIDLKKIKVIYPGITI